MKKIILTITAALLLGCAFAQTTSYGSGFENAVYSNAVTTDNSLNGTVVLAGASITLQNNSSYSHYNNKFTVNGAWNVTTGSVDSFNVKGSDTITGSVAPNFFNAAFNMGALNNMAITNTQGINIANNLAIKNGITSTVRSNFQQGALHFLSGATYTANLSDNSHVDGYVNKQGSDAFSFPIGSATDYRSLSMTAPTNNASISASWLVGNPGLTSATKDGVTHTTTSFGDSLVLLYTGGQWDFINQTPATNALTITASMPDMTGFDVPSNLRLVGWNGTKWINLSVGAFTLNGNIENSIISGTLPAGGAGITAFGIGSINWGTPELKDFNSTLFNCKAILVWTTVTDIHGAIHEVQHSVDGTNYTKIATLASASQIAGNVYHYTDSLLSDGNNYFRLKITNKDGQFIFSPVQTVINHCIIVKNITAYPNPARDYIIVSGLTGVNKISLTDQAGSKMMAVVVTDGITGKQRIDVSRLPKGLYFVHVVDAFGAISNVKVFIQ